MASLICTDFFFNGLHMSDFGFITATLDSPSIDAIDIGLKKNLKTEKVGSNPVNYLYDVSYEDSLVFQTTMVYEDGHCLTMEEFRTVVRWLTTKNYMKMEIDNDKCRGIYFNCIVSDIKMYEYNGLPVGIYFEATCDSPYGWEDVTYNYTKSPCIFNNTSDDILNPVKPVFHFAVSKPGDVTLVNTTTGKCMILSSVLKEETCTIDTKHYLLLSDIPERNFYAAFNREWIDLVPGENTISFSGIPSLTISASLPRKVGY
ncbi:phage tail domain-containing protein [Qiania dongpingensis]|uniref:Uncharacterized protein n=1 Tax=Qiania dongpingensis TaxID=2763669 RepID=A0A7G9G5K1_9FIRM|nr:phage tail domain-containing protein [Qiania dongpingensis]QNM06083.1 hypothetical protein H9Q78_02660 [Qiania dongpingensis]